MKLYRCPWCGQEFPHTKVQKHVAIECPKKLKR